MKKAKLILSLICVFAIVGGILAFKANRYMPLAYYTCNTIVQTCGRTWTIGGFITTLYDPAATATVQHAATSPDAFGVDCADACTYSNTVYIEPGF